MASLSDVVERRIGPGRGGVELAGGSPSSNSGHPKPMIRLFRLCIWLGRTVLSSTGNGTGDSRGAGGSCWAFLRETFRLGDDCFDFDFDLAKLGWEGWRARGGVSSPGLSTLSLLTRPDQSPEEDRKMFRTEVRFFCRSVNPGGLCIADSIDGCGLFPGKRGDFRGKLGD